MVRNHVLKYSYHHSFLALETSSLMSSTSTTDDGEHSKPENFEPLQQVNREDTKTMLKPSSVAIKFWDTTVQLTNMLQSSDHRIIVDTCKSLRASEQADIALFTASYLETITNSETTVTSAKVLQNIIPFTNWLDHSILTAVVEACNVPEAAALLTQFDDRIDTSQPVTKYPVPFPSHYMVPYDTSTHTVLAVQLKLQLDHSTLQNVLDTRSLIQEKCEVTPHCLQLLAVAKTSHTLIYWTIPNNVTALIALNVLQYQSFFYLKGIEQIAIHPGIVLLPVRAVGVGLFTIFAKVSHLTMLSSIIHIKSIN